jgi:hypothetical protein
MDAAHYTSAGDRMRLLVGPRFAPLRWEYRR